jgi:molybdopterin-binding protein
MQKRLTLVDRGSHVAEWTIGATIGQTDSEADHTVVLSDVDFEPWAKEKERQAAGLNAQFGWMADFSTGIRDIVALIGVTKSTMGSNYWEAAMQISARNMLKGKIKQIIPGAVNSEVILETASGETIVSVITKESVEKLGLKAGKDAYAVIKASSVLIAVD